MKFEKHYGHIKLHVICGDCMFPVRTTSLSYWFNDCSNPAFYLIYCKVSSEADWLDAIQSGRNIEVFKKTWNLHYILSTPKNL